jgi:cytochrome c-type biogenesis protein
MAGQSGNTAAAVMHLSVYSLGLALPFIAVALFFDTFLKRLPSLRRHMALIQRISGITLIIIGIMILSGHFSAFNILAQRMIFGYIDWAEGRALPFRLFADWLIWLRNF